MILLNGGSSAGTSEIVRHLQGVLPHAASQQRWRRSLDGLDVLWVGVRCDSTVAAERERARGRPDPGMAVAQATAVHEGVVYDLEVDTTHTDSLRCAKTIAARVDEGIAPQRK
ncbi:phosphotransferase-like protein [Microbispora siamensis]